MDIKLRARLSAYSKIESINGLSSNVPDADATAAGSILGVNDNGNYTLFPSVESVDIDSLFSDVVQEEVVTKADIDTLFEDNTEFEEVTKEEIDTLFKDGMDEPGDIQKIGTVTFADIDSLFK